MEQLAELVTVGPYQHPVKVLRCLCPDGRRRTVRITSEPDTFFSIPARVKVRGKTVTGYVTGRETDDYERDMEFRPYLYRKNHAVFANG